MAVGDERAVRGAGRCARFLPTAAALVAALSLLESPPPLVVRATPYLLLSGHFSRSLPSRSSRQDTCTCVVRVVVGWRLGCTACQCVCRKPLVGALRSEIVLPRWALELDDESLDLVIRHEAEHVKSHDTRLITIASVVTALVPWNPWTWWQFGRLRLAVELDCDARVLARVPARRRYADLLLRLSQSSARTPLAAAALSEPKSFLRKRIEMIGTRSVRGRWPRTLGALAVVAGTIAVACEVPAPTDPPAGQSPAPSMASNTENRPFWIDVVLKPMESVRIDLQHLTPRLEGEGWPLVFRR